MLPRRLTPLLLAIAATACTALEERVAPPIRETRFLPAEGLEELQPAEIALAPIRNQSPTADLPLERIRGAFYEELVQRLYSPLSLAFVDEHWKEASFSHATPPEGLLLVTITEWDPTHLTSAGELLVGAELRLYEGGSAVGRLLWGVTLRRKIDLTPGQNQRPPGLMRDVLPEAVRMFAREALGLLPERDPLALDR